MQSRKHLLALAENIISLIWSLTEANHKTLTAVNGAGVEGLLLKVLQGRQIMGVGGALAAGELYGFLVGAPADTAQPRPCTRYLRIIHLFRSLCCKRRGRYSC